MKAARQDPRPSVAAAILIGSLAAAANGDTVSVGAGFSPHSAG